VPVRDGTRPRGALFRHVVAQLSVRCGRVRHVCPLVWSGPRRRFCGGVVCEPAGLGGGQGDVHPRVAQAPLDQGLALGGNAEGTQRRTGPGRAALELPSPSGRMSRTPRPGSCARPRGGPGCRARRSSPKPRLMRSRRLTAHSSAPHPAQMIFAYLLCVSAGRSPVVRIVPFVDRVIRSTSPGSMIMKRPT